MPYDNPSNSDGDMLSDSPAQKGDVAGEDSEDTPHDTGTTALVPSSICPGMKPGDEMVLHIDEVQDDQYLCSYAPEKGKEKKSDKSESKPMKSKSRDSEMDSMMY